LGKCRGYWLAERVFELWETRCSRTLIGVSDEAGVDVFGGGWPDLGAGRAKINKACSVRRIVRGNTTRRLVTVERRRAVDLENLRRWREVCIA